MYSKKKFRGKVVKGISNVILPTKIDWLKATGVTKTRQPKIDTFKSLTFGTKGLKQTTKLIGL